MLSRDAGFASFSAQAMQLLQHVPAGWERGIERHGLTQGGDRGRPLSQGDQALRTLLMKPTEARMVFPQALKRRQRLGDASLFTQRPGFTQQRFSIVSRFGTAHDAALSNGASHAGSGWSASKYSKIRWMRSVPPALRTQWGPRLSTSTASPTGK